MTLENNIRKMARWRGDDYRPRTRHLDDRGRAIYTNRLFLESSPYLLQHAHNPVDWFPWGDEAFDTARRLDRPVLLSVGYSTCHWCHVMEEESFEDDEIARTINNNYIAVKVDREERPDVDAIYMSAVQAITGRGGWPMTVWLTPDREPFYGGTYFPARDGERSSPVGFLTMLKKIRESYDDKRDLVARSAGELARTVRQMLAPAAGGCLPIDSVLDRAVLSGKNRFDTVHGGVAGAPKFPSSFPVRLMLRHHRRSGDADCLNMAVLTLEKMAAGGMNDHVGGGFHRYSTDAQWQVPHFEKMLYDNALLVTAYIEGWQATGNHRFRQVALKTLDYVAREMTSPAGAFFSATDADSLTPSGHREEGWFFTWTLEELSDALGADDARIAAAVYGVDDRGSFEGRNILFLPRDLDSVAGELGLSTKRLSSEVERINAALYARRQQRPAPLRDDKIIAAWNGLMISAFSRAGFALGDSACLDRASRAANFILDQMVLAGRLRRSFKDGAASGNGFLDDHAFFTAGLLDLFEATADLRWLERAVDFDHILADHFEDRENGGFFMTADDHEALIAREKPALDGALPSGNAVALMNLLRLNALTLDPSYLKRAEKGFTPFSSIMAANPSAFGEMFLAVEVFLYPPCQVIVITPAGGDDAAFTDRLRTSFLPGSLVMIVSESSAAHLSRRFPLFRGKTAAGGKTNAYVCRNGACQLPVTTVGALMQQLTSP
ncbi:thioredoxin domain-containing protein [uncultured Desulfosarcina sp.]|uniref:thioredoxin domain-containing protein n=1 Tax=uncultured Desulfosarcina sp. TaxID=218289 RepID=UPI0029C8223D|nr:thioredoxin domain-containing protein [uncultured Desulfosarcina sp.]